MTNRRMAVAMSGGVDSSVAALLLYRGGSDLVGLSLQLHDQSDGDRRRFGRCCSPRDFLDARVVANRIGFPFYVVNMEEEFRRAVLDDFVHEYAAGRTPLPCAHCNSVVKFGDLVRRAQMLGCDKVATGHYARLSRDPISGRRLLLRGRDPDKDQSYFLHGLTQEQLERVEFPVGELTKTQVRDVAREAGLPVHDKPESMDVCFLAEDGYQGFLEREMGENRPAPGEIVDKEGKVLGQHEGIHRFTVGQRKGLGVAGQEARYVLEIRAAERKVVVGKREEQYRSLCRVARPNWVSIDAPRARVEVQVQIRYRHAGVEATVEPDGPDSVQVRFRQPQRAVTPGQAAVFYDNEKLLGGGPIESSH